jgi:DUF2958 family protein
MPRIENTKEKKQVFIPSLLLAMNPSAIKHQAQAVDTLPESIQKNKLLPKKVRKLLPPLGSTEGQRDPKAVVKFFTPDSAWTWFATEYDGADQFFGLVDGFERELGYFSLKELLRVRGHLNLPVERDLYFEPTPLSELS